MALRQTALVCELLVAAHPELGVAGAVEIVTIRTSGDRIQNRLLAEVGGKGLFAKEIEESGFKQVEEKKFMKQSYFLRFEKVELKK